MDVDQALQSVADAELQAVTATLNSSYLFTVWQAGCVVGPKQVRLQALTADEKHYLWWYPELIANLEWWVEKSLALTRELAAIAAQEWEVSLPPEEWAMPKRIEFEKVCATLLQFARE